MSKATFPQQCSTAKLQVLLCFTVNAGNKAHPAPQTLPHCGHILHTAQLVTEHVLRAKAAHR